MLNPDATPVHLRSVSSPKTGVWDGGSLREDRRPRTISLVQNIAAQAAQTTARIAKYSDTTLLHYFHAPFHHTRSSSAVRSHTRVNTMR